MCILEPTLLRRHAVSGGGSGKDVCSTHRCEGAPSPQTRAASRAGPLPGCWTSGLHSILTCPALGCLFSPAPRKRRRASAGDSGNASRPCSTASRPSRPSRSFWAASSRRTTAAAPPAAATCSSRPPGSRATAHRGGVARREKPSWPRGQTARLPRLLSAAGGHGSPTRVPLAELVASEASREVKKRCLAARAAATRAGAEYVPPTSPG